MLTYAQLINRNALEAFKDSAPRAAAQFADAAYGVVLARNLEAVDPQIFLKKYPELTFMNSGITIDNTGGFAETIKSLRIRDQGEFRNAGDNSTNKGVISIAGDNSSLQVKEREAMSSYTDTEVKQANLQNVNLPSKVLEAHSKVFQQEIDRSGYIGIKDITGSTGLLNHAGFTTVAASDVVANLTPKELYEELAGLIDLQWGAVNMTPEYMANRVSTTIPVILALSGVYDTTSGKTVRMMLKENYPTVEFVGTIYATTDFLASTRTVAWSTGDEVMKYRLPLQLTIGEIIKIGSFSWKLDSKYRTAGVDILENSGGYIMTGL